MLKSIPCFFFSELVREFGSFILIADGDKHETVWNIVSFSFKIITVNNRIPTRPGKPGKMRVHLENLEISWNFEKFNKYHGKMT